MYCGMGVLGDGIGYTIAILRLSPVTLEVPTPTVPLSVSKRLSVLTRVKAIDKAYLSVLERSRLRYRPLPQVFSAAIGHSRRFPWKSTRKQ